MNNVITLKLKDIGPVKMCKRVLKSQTHSEGDVPFFKIKTFGNKPDAYISDELFEKYKTAYNFPTKGSILISAAGTLGRVVKYKGERAYFQDSNIVWIDNDESVLLNDYLYYFYLTKPWQVTSGSTIPRLYNKDIENITITFPKDIDQQRKVVAVLKKLDSKIANNNAISKELESMAKTIYDYWFLQFEFPDKDGKPYKSNGGKMVWNDQLKQEIPEGWEVKYLSDIESNIVTGKTPSTKDKTNFGKDVPFICIGDIRNHSFINSTAISLSEKGANSQKKKFIPSGSLCVSCIATPGLIGFTTKDSQTNQQINTIVFNNIKNKYFLYFALFEYFNSNKNVKTGNTFSNMNKEEFSKIKIIYNKKLVDEYFNTVNSYFEKIKLCEFENEQLQSLRDFLLPMLMNGQVIIED